MQTISVTNIAIVYWLKNLIKYAHINLLCSYDGLYSGDIVLSLNFAGSTLALLQQ